MVRLKTVYLITDEGFVIYSQSFGATEQDQDMVGSLIMALTTFGKEILSERGISGVEFGGKDKEGADMILEEGNRIKAIAIVALDKDNRERDEYNVRKQMMTLIRDVEENYSLELEDPIFRKGSFQGVETLIAKIFFRDKMSRIPVQQFEGINVYLKYPSTLLFEITPRGEKIYSFYREFPDFIKLMKNISREEFEHLIYSMQDKNSMVSFKDCLERFGEDNSREILELLTFLTRKGMFDAYNFELISVEV